MHRSSGQFGFGDAWLAEGLGRNERLERISSVIDWQSVGRLVEGIHPNIDRRLVRCA